MHSHYERIRDFQCAFYALSPFSGEFWQQARDQPVPQPLAHKIALFRARGEVASMEDETFFPDSWQALLVRRPRRDAGAAGRPQIEGIPLSQFNHEFRRILETSRARFCEQPHARSILEAVPELNGMNATMACSSTAELR